MPKIDRNSIQDAQLVIEKLMPDINAREKILDFLADAITYANGLKPNNWNLNLDKNGQYVQFNIGYEFGIFITQKNLGVLVLRDVLKNICNPNKLEVEFRGILGKNSPTHQDIDTAPDILAKVPGSIVCQANYIKMSGILPILEKANRTFINYAIHRTKLVLRMTQSHSPGLIAYLSKVTGGKVPDPHYYITETSFYQEIEASEQKIKKLSKEELTLKITTKQSTKPEKVDLLVSKFKRDPYVVAYTKLRANGICQDCLQPAPFINKFTKEPFLEIHHVVPLAQGGTDTIENTVALCPNCHRKRHYE